MRNILILFILVLFSMPVEMSASVVSDIENAVKIYSTNSERGIAELLDVYNRRQADLQIFKSILYERQSYQLFSELLERIPPGKETADEILQMNLILGKTSEFPADLSNYLKYYPAASVAEKYPDLIVKNAYCLDTLRTGYQPGLFLILKKSYSRMKRFAQFDAFLALSGTNGGIPPAEVKNYLRESWPLSQRNVKSVLRAFALDQDPELKILSAASAFLSKNYAETLDYYPALLTEFRQKENQVKTLQIDLPYLFFYSLFREARYRNAIQDITRFYFPDRNDISELRFLCYLGSGDLKNATREIKSMRENSKVYFYSGISLMMDNPSNGIEYFERYLQELDESQTYLPESMLIYHTLANNPVKVPVLMEMLKGSLLFQDTMPVKEILLSYPFVLDPSQARSGKQADLPNGQRSYMNGYMRYCIALGKAGSGDEAGAKKVLFELIRSTNTSPMVRSMAVYQTRDLE